MTTLRLTQSTLSADRFRIEAALEADGQPRRTATAEVASPITPQDREDLRWYLEEYLQHAADPAPRIAARIEKRIAEIGAVLFTALFQSDDDSRDLWATVRDRIHEMRIEIVSEVREAASVPWELIRDPKTDTPLSLSASAFVRAAYRSARTPRVAQSSAGSIRILLVICRPGGDRDVPFRSVASRLIKAVHGNARGALQLDVLRPPTFSEFSAVLREAKSNGVPYHVVHFDGHGAFFDAGDLPASWFLSPPRAGAHGYLVFENPLIEQNHQFVDGLALGSLLWETEVPVLVLNACRSAHAEPRSHPDAGRAQDVHTEARAFGSLAQEVVDLGIGGVVAMRYNVYVVTAAQFVVDLYEALANGETLGEAVTLGRKQLQAQPLREIAYEPRPLQDWMVPIVYEAAPIALFARPERKRKLNIKVSGDAAAPSSELLAGEVEERPDVGFFGRDETLLALDRAFDTQSIVLLHAYAGSGKSATAKEFARWYHLTGGIRGPVIFTSFERHKPLEQVLNESVGHIFESALENNGIHWLALTGEQRRDVTLQLLSQVPVLWIWDNVEPVRGFPTGTASAWTDDEQVMLAAFLDSARQTKAKFLLTSRRDEREWLGSLPARIEIPPMPTQERVQLARALAEKHRRRLTDVDDWMPLLRFTRGNPMTITVLVGQALRDGLRTRAQIENFVDRLRAGETAFNDEASEGRDRSLAASLAYGFEHAFTDTERAQLALLFLFQGFVDVDAFVFMGSPVAPWCLAEVRGLTRESGIALLDRAAGIGLLASLGGGYYSVHPALPWFFRNLFETKFASTAVDDGSTRLKAILAFVEAMGALAGFYFHEFEGGNRGVIAALSAEAPNLLHARRLARMQGWHANVVAVMQGLWCLYEQTGQRAEWARLVEEILPDFVDLASDGPLEGREDEWGIVTGYRVRLARQSRNWVEAEGVQHTLVDWARKKAAPLLTLPIDTLDIVQRNVIRTLGISLHELAQIQRQLKQPACVASYEESLAIAHRIADRSAAATCAYNLGNAMKDFDDLDKAERWYRQSLELRDERDSPGRARCLIQLGQVACERFLAARATTQLSEELLSRVNAALSMFFEALDLLPPTALDDLDVAHTQIGNIYDETGYAENARSHWRQSIRCAEAAENPYSAGQSRLNIAISFAGENRLSDAREYALAALHNFESFGPRASEVIQKTRALLSQIEQRMQSQSSEQSEVPPSGE